MPKNLVIVESPAKAKTIEKFLGKDYSVKSSYGHIRDLPKKGLNIDIEHNFKPTYDISPEKTKTISELKKAAATAETVWLASDEDREGEAIAWHLCQALKLDEKKTKRIVFHEITKTAIDEAIKSPRTVDQNLVDAQQARRVLDRLVGYELSPVLWKKVRSGLSAGRVQSVSVRLIVEREREIATFKPESSYKITAVFKTKGEDFNAELATKLKDQGGAKEFLESAKGAMFTITKVDQKPGTRNPSPPFTTSSLQQEAARRLGYGVRQTMTIAQKLYESGYITYMRTDSTTLSGLAQKAAADYINKSFGQKYHDQQQYQTKSAGAQEAHEAIRPTDFNRQSVSDASLDKLYQLIWRRALASQMAAAQLERTEATIKQSTRDEPFVAKGEVLTFDGFFKVYGRKGEDSILPVLNEGDALTLISMAGTQTFSRPPARYSEGSLVKKMEELGIGRPSTYAPTISTIQAREYVEKKDLDGTERKVNSIVLEKGQIKEEVTTEVTGADKNKLLPTYLGDVTTDFLTKHFATILDYDFTAKSEDDLDNIADGKQSWPDMIKDFYANFHPLIEKSENVSRQEASQARTLGKHPKTKKPIVARFGKYGPMLQMGETESEEKPTFAPMPADSTLEEVTLEQALPMFELPRTVGKTEAGEEIKSNIGRFGPYIQVGKLFVSLKEKDPLTITEKEARELYADKLKAEAEKHIQEFPGGIKVLNGPYGPYVTDGKKNARIPKTTDPTKLSEAECKELLAQAPAKGKRFRRSPKSR